VTATAPTYLRPLDAASDYLARGWSVLPVGQDKRPLGLWAEYQKRRATDAELSEWRSKWGDAGVGIIAGAISGLLIVDIDAKDAASFATAKERLSACLSDSLVCPMARTRSGGEHWYFKRPEPGMGNRAHVDGLPIDIRCDGGYVVAPPTPGYSWIVSPYDCELPEPPQPLLALLAKPRPVVQTPTPAAHRNRDPGYDNLPDRTRRYVSRMPSAIAGQGGHDALYRVAVVIFHGFGLDDSDGWDVICEYSARCDPPWSEKELNHKINDARTKPHREPFGYLRDAVRADTPLEPEEEYEVGGAPPSVPASKPVIKIGVDQHRVVRESISALAHQRRYFQRGTSLYRIVQPSAPDGEPRPLPHLDLVPATSLEIALSAAADWEKAKQTKDGIEWIEAKPPTWAVHGVHSAAQWSGIPPLVGVVSSPCLRRDGTVLDIPGYDAPSGLIYRPIGAVNPIPAEPTIDDAVRARDQLLELVKDFPFAGDEYRSAWLSCVLTPFARHALRDSAPLFYIDANTRGSGKSLLATITSIIATGRQVPMSSFADDEEEREKRITTLMIEGTSFVIFDNVEGTLGGQSLNIILTSGSWKGRILGTTVSTGELPLRTTFLATGNNCDFSQDTPRRTIHIRLLSPLEHPECRTDFDHPYLIEWVHSQRAKLAAACLTILRAYKVAGLPAMGLPAMGGFTDWHRVVRSAVVWVGMQDPVKTQEMLTATADRSTAELSALLLGIKCAQTGTSDWLTAQELLQIAETPQGRELHEALLEYCPSRRNELPTARAFGVKLRHHVDRVHSGMVLRRTTGAYTRWRVRNSDAE
jgi:hypothetical protein